MAQSLKIRSATEADLPALCELCAQLGYRGLFEAIAENLRGILGRPERALLVADEDGNVLGYADLAVRRRLVHPPMAELESLVVLDSARNRGVGKALLAAVEAWARTMGLHAIALGSRVARKDAHRFYEREGYERTKEQAIYTKRLAQ